MAVRITARPLPKATVSPPDNEPDNDGDEPKPTPTYTPPPPPPPTPTPMPYSGIYSCSMLEQLWIANGGNPGAAFVAAEIARAESGGNPQAVSPSDDIGLWQINAPSWGAMASFDPVVNVHSAITISANGTNWSPWVTYVQGLYIGQC